VRIALIFCGDCEVPPTNEERNGGVLVLIGIDEGGLSAHDQNHLPIRADQVLKSHSPPGNAVLHADVSEMFPPLLDEGTPSSNLSELKKSAKFWSTAVLSALSRVALLQLCSALYGESSAS
jgi:hypothetical protein